MGFAAVNTGNNLLFLVVSALLGFMTVSGVIGWLNIRGVALSVHLPDEIYDGQETFVTLRLENRKRWIPSFLLRVDLEGASTWFHILDGGGTVDETVPLTFRGRGVKELREALSSSPFPINFFVRSTTLPLAISCVVFPRPIPCGLPQSPVAEGGKGGTESRGRGYDGEMEAIADYSGVEPRKLIHWRLSARHGELKVKRLTATSDLPLLIDVATLPGKGLEERLSCGVWNINRSIRANRPVGLIIGTKVIPPDTSRPHRLRLLRELALHGLGQIHH